MPDSVGEENFPMHAVSSASSKMRFPPSFVSASANKRRANKNGRGHALCCVKPFVRRCAPGSAATQRHDATCMHNQLPVTYIARHGETPWTITGQHTGLTDLPLTPQGEQNAKALAGRLKGMAFAKVLTSPLQRARQTCTLAGFGSVAEAENDLVEWDYGEYEGLRSAEIRAKPPDWQLFRDGAPGGESPCQLMARADNVWRRVREVKGNVLLFASGHFIRVLAARWIGLEPSVHSNSFLLSTASLSAVGYDQDCSHPVMRLWNDTHHVSI